MCDIDKIAALIAAASIALVAAIVLFALAAFNAGAFWLAFGNVPVMIAAAILVAAALASVGAAIAAMNDCYALVPRCTAQEDTIFYALMGASAGLSALLTATIVGTFGSAIPGAGVIVAVALVAGGIACSVSLGIIAAGLSGLNFCVRAAPTTPAVTVAIVASMVASTLVGFVTLMLSGEAALTGRLGGPPPPG